MKTTSARFDIAKPVIQLAVTGAVILAPLAMAADSAQAKPPKHAPAWGYGGKKGKGKNNKKGKKDKDKHNRDRRDRDNDRDDDDRDDDDRDDDDRDDDDREFRTFTGRVTRDLSDNVFEIRTTDGRSFRVRGPEPGGLSVGDRVRIYGQFDPNQSSVFLASNINILRDRDNDYGDGDDNGNGGKILTFTGRVLVVSGNSFTIRTDKGGIIVVRWSGADTLERGDQVRVSGTSPRSKVLDATNVVVL